MLLLRWWVIAFLLSSLSNGVSVQHAQSDAQKKRGSAPPPSTASKKEEERTQAVAQIRTLSDRVAGFRSLGERTRVLIAFAELLWTADRDYARQLLTKTCDTLSSASANPSGPQSTPESREVARLRRESISRIAKLDPDLAWRLIDLWFSGEAVKNLDPQSRSMIYLQTALNLAELQSDAAVKFAEQSLKGGVSQTTVSFLQKMKQADEAAARRFFMTLLTTLGGEESVGADDLLLLGSYVFSPPEPDQSASVAAANGITWALVGDFTVVNIAGREAAVSIDQVRAYLRVASATLSRPARTGKERVLNYFAAYQLLPYVRQFLPTQAGEVESVLQSLKTTVPPQWTQHGSLSNLGPIRVGTTDEIVAEIENETNGSKRDALALTLLHSACVRADFTLAETLVQYISDLGVRAKLKTLIAFSRGARALEQGDVQAARQSADRLDLGVEVAVLWLGIGRRYIEAGEKTNAAEALVASLQYTRKLERNEAAPILMSAAGQFARFDPNTALQVLAESVQLYNGIEAQAYKPFRWVQPVQAGDREVLFSLGKGIERGFAPALERIVAADKDGATTAVLRLTSEKVLGEALVALSGALLKPRP